MQSYLSSQTYTFLFSDIEGSTRLWERFPHAMKTALQSHDSLLRAAVESSHGQVVKNTGDGLMAIFTSAYAAVSACLQAQLSLQAESWGETGPLHVRMGLHVGEAELRDGDYYGPAVNRAARLMSVAYGGQVLLSAAAAALVVDRLPEEVSLRDLGEFRLKDLERPEQVFQLVHPDLRTDFPPLISPNRQPGSLPAPPSPLIGREQEVIEITKQLSSEGLRLLTLIGPGGIGKTRLALQVASQLLDIFLDGVYFVDLAPIRDPDSVLSVIAQTIGFRQTSNRSLLSDLQGYIGTKRILLLLDNFEQVTAAAASLVDLLQASPNLKLMVTSREALNVRGEHLIPVPPLSLPEANLKDHTLEQLTQYDAVRLFIERAQAVKPDFKITPENAHLIAEICLRLDGLPLAIELAAARIKLFSPQGLLDRMGNRMDLLRGGPKDLPSRQQTLQGTIQWSYDLLDRGEQRLFELLSVFPGGSTFETTEAVASRISHLNDIGLDLLDGMASLVDKSLIRQVGQPDGQSRLMMLETLREFASGRLDENFEFCADAHQAHATYFADFTRHQWDRLPEGDKDAILGLLEADIENVHAAWGYWVEKRDLDQLSKFVDLLWVLYDSRGWYQATVNLTNDLLNILSSTPSSSGSIQQEIMLQTSLARALLAIKGFTPEAERAFTRAFDLSQAMGEVPQLFPVLRGLASVYTYLREFDKAAQMAEKILNLAGRLDDASMRIEGHLVLGYNLAFQGKVALGLNHLGKALANYDPDKFTTPRFQLGNNPGVVGFSVSALLLWMLGFPNQALERTHAALNLAKKLNHPISMAYALFHSGLLYLWMREPGPAHDRALAVLDLADQHEFLAWKAVASCLQGSALAGLGRPEVGLPRLIQGIDSYQVLKSPPVFWPMLLFLKAGVYLQVGKPRPGLSVIDEALEIIGLDGRDLSSPEFYRLKGDLLLALSPNHTAEAEDWFQRALKAAQNHHLPMLELRAALSLAHLWRQQARIEPGQQLLSDIYNRFSEGFSYADLVEARELINR